MTRIRPVDPVTAEGRTAEVYARLRAYYGIVPALQQALGYLPETTGALWDLSLATVREGVVPEELKRAFFVVTAHGVECTYCVAAHVLALRGAGWTLEECRGLLEGRAPDRLGPKERSAVAFARLAGRRPAAVTDAEVDGLRGQGWTDAEIAEIVAAVALMRYTSTVATALAVPLERAMRPIVVALGLEAVPGADGDESTAR